MNPFAESNNFLIAEECTFQVTSVTCVFIQSSSKVLQSHWKHYSVDCVSVFWDRTPCSPAEVNQYFRATFHLHLPHWRVNQARNQHVAGSKLCFNPEDGGDMFLHSVSWLSLDNMASYHRRQTTTAVGTFNHTPRYWSNSEEWSQWKVKYDILRSTNLLMPCT
jgi:hypothetical protein